MVNKEKQNKTRKLSLVWLSLGAGKASPILLSKAIGITKM
jgi:hypothetical protein